MPDLSTSNANQSTHGSPVTAGTPYVISVSERTEDTRKLKTESVMFNVSIAKTYGESRLASMIKNHLSGAMLQHIDLSKIFSGKADKISFTMNHDSARTAARHQALLTKLQAEAEHTPFRNYSDISRIISGIHHNTSNTFPPALEKKMNLWMLSLFVEHLESLPKGQVATDFIQSLKNSLLLAEYKEQGAVLEQQQLFDQLKNNNPNSFLINISGNEKYAHAWGQLYQQKNATLNCLTVNKGYSPEMASAGHHYTEQKIDKVVKTQQLSDFYTSEQVGNATIKEYAIHNYGGQSQLLGNCAYLATPNVLGAAVARASGQRISGPQDYKSAKMLGNEKVSDLMIRLMIQDASRRGTITPVEAMMLNEQVTNKQQVKHVLKDKGVAIFNHAFPYIEGGISVKAIKKYQKDLTTLLTNQPLSASSDIKGCCQTIINNPLVLAHNKRDYLSLLAEDISKNTSLTPDQKIHLLGDLLDVAQTDADLVQTGFSIHALHYLDKIVLQETFTAPQARAVLDDARIMHHIRNAVAHSAGRTKATGIAHPIYLLNNLVNKAQNLNNLKGKAKLFQALGSALQTSQDAHQKAQMLQLLATLSTRPKLAAYMNYKTSIPKVLSSFQQRPVNHSHHTSVEQVTANLRKHQVPYWAAKIFG